MFCFFCLCSPPLPGFGWGAGNRVPLRTIQQVLSSGSGSCLAGPSQKVGGDELALPSRPRRESERIRFGFSDMGGRRIRHPRPQGKSVLANSPMRSLNTDEAAICGLATETLQHPAERPRPHPKRPEHPGSPQSRARPWSLLLETAEDRHGPSPIPAPSPAGILPRQNAPLRRSSKRAPQRQNRSPPRPNAPPPTRRPASFQPRQSRQPRQPR